MERVFIKARAKVNLNLIVLDKREDGYHNIKSVFQKIDLFDELNIYKTDTDDIELKTNIESINNKDNIICKAYYKLKEKYYISGVKVILNKKIPMQAGMGGGSSDCASFIIGINELFALNMTKEEMEEIGKSLGADVVPCLYDGAVLAEGIGDIVTKINSSFKYYLVVIKPQMNCNTKEMYQRLDEKRVTEDIDTTNDIITALETNDLQLLSKSLYNSFENAIENKELIDSIKAKLVENGALGSLMTGSRFMCIRTLC